MTGGVILKKWVKILGFIAFLSVILVGCSSQTSSKSSSSSSKTNKSTSSKVTSGASQQGYSDPKTMKSKYDIVIVGAGGAGMTAAIEAKQQGMNPVILEKMPIAGGNTLKASSGMNASQTKVEAAQGVKDSNDQFYEETLKGGGGTNDKALLRYFVDNSAGAIDWLDSIGIKLDKLTISGGMSVKRTHRPHDGSAVGGYLVDGLVKEVKKENIPQFVNTDVTKLNETNGKITGVTAKVNQDKTKKIVAKAVIVTTGGFGASKQLIKKYRPDLAHYVTTNQAGATGDGIKMIEKVGGYAIDMKKIQIHPTVNQSKHILIGEATRGEGGILVNQSGKRFFNEMNTRDKVSAAINKQKGKYAWVVIDSGVRQRSSAIDFYIKDKLDVEGKTLNDLAKKMKVPATTLQKTVATWNDAVNNKKDSEFGRTTGMDHGLTTGPYYAFKIAPGIHYTMGGVKINTKTEVLTKKQQPIPGLYAAGEVAGGLHGNNRIGGNSVADIVIFGRQAGTQATAFAKAQ